MRLYNQILLLVFFLLLVGCKNKYGCDNDCVLDKIIFYNASLDDLNYVKIEGYQKDSDFTILMDTSYIVLELTEYDVSAYYMFEGTLNKEINPDLDYKIHFPYDDRYCQITGINIVDEICYDGIIFNDYVKAIEEYYVNGTRFTCQEIKAIPFENYR